MDTKEGGCMEDHCAENAAEKRFFSKILLLGSDSGVCDRVSGGQF